MINNIFEPLALPATEIELEISLYEAKKGTSRIVVVKDPAVCPECAHVQHRRCRQKKCAHCGGQGYVHTYRQVELDLPAGILTGEEITYPELGRYNLCAQKNSNLIVKIKISAHPYLELTGNTISCTLVVPFIELILSKKISVPTASGRQTIKLHPLAMIGKVYRLKGQGLSGGDQLVNIEILPWQKSGKPKPGGQFCMNCRAAT